MTPFPRRGLYVITTTGAPSPQALIAGVEQAILGGAVAVQYRNKSTEQERRKEEAGLLLALCRHHHVPLIINDDVALARSAGADGVHLGRDDWDAIAARQVLGPTATIGVSCYNVPELALRAQHAGADYVAFGRFFPSRTKPNAVQATLGMLTRVRPALVLPVVAIGGVTPENGRAVLAAGADLLAVIDGVLGQADPQAAARGYADLFAAQNC